MTKPKNQGNKSTPTKPRKVYLQAVDGVTDAGIAKLESSGLTIEDASLLGIGFLTAAQTKKLSPLTFKELPALKFNYYGLDGKPYKVQPKWPDFFRIRYLGEVKDFNSITDGKNPRYTQPPDSGVAAYFPRNVDWSKVVGDVGVPIIITEGELKAAKACKEGFTTIGLGGVWNFKSAKNGVAFLPELEKINWVKRTVRICFDSDYQTKSDICSAINILAEELVERGAIVLLATLPQIMDDADAKTGLDDFLVLDKTGNGLDEVLAEAQPITLVQPLWKLNNEVCYVRSPGLVVEHNTFQKIAPGAFKDHAFSTTNVSERIVKADGSISLKKVSAAGAWLKWPYRLEASKLTYAPGQEKFIAADMSLNVWKGWGCSPKKGNAKMFLQLVDHIFNSAPPEIKHWFLQWCAYPLQYPGTKMFTSCVIHGTRHGTGKSLIGYTLGEIYGENFTEISQADLHGNHNEWAEAKQLIMGDDVTGSNKRQDNDLIKKLITQKQLRLNPKFIPAYTVPDVINYYFTSNHPDCFFLEDDDRRAFIWEVMVGCLSEAFYMEYTKALFEDKTLAPAVFDFLLNYDLTGFNPQGRAPLTEAKQRMISGTKSELGLWCRKVIDYPETILKIGEMPLKQDVFTGKQLLALYDPHGKTTVTSNGLSREMIRAGAVHACGGRAVRVHGDVDRYLAIRNIKQWMTSTGVDVTAHLEKVTAPPVKGKF